MRGNHTCRTPAPLTGQCPLQLLGLGPGQSSCPRGVSHVYHSIVDLKLSNLPLQMFLFDGRAAIDGIGTEGHSCALSGQTVKTRRVSIKMLRQHQYSRAVAAGDGYTSC